MDHLFQLNALKDGEQVTHGITDCETPEFPAITPDIPLRERALCYFEYFLNYNPLVCSDLTVCPPLN